ncbi:MAG TPA: class I SAM-dependent DNA methyltransferase [Anaerolineae bacterium]|nr:class I SAM-dependent DNA methyltransferase [Anaerolineae bacterium]
MNQKNEQISQTELESYLWGAATLLRGFIDAGDYKQFIFPLMFFKRLCDVYDEEKAASIAELGADFPEFHRFQIPEGAHWEDVRGATQNVGIAIQTALREIEKENGLLDGIFGDSPWTNKNRLSDETLTNLIEHFSTQTLSRARVNEDLLGQAYEYLIKKFADDSGHTAAEFYTNRTVVHLMTRLLAPQEGESIYDPTCGSGGMLLSAAAAVRRQGKDTRTLRMYGQEINLMTSAIARMNLFLHGFEDFYIARDDTLAKPYFKMGDRLQTFDVILANPPYSISSWNRTAWETDGRNIYGTPPQGRADFAFWQHILASLDDDKGRCAILFPHGVLFREDEQHMRQRIIEADLIDAIIGIGENLFYNSMMEACIVICRTKKMEQRKDKILFIDAKGLVTRQKTYSYLEETHIQQINDAYHSYVDQDGFAKVVSIEQVLENDASLKINIYVDDRVAVYDIQKPLPIIIEEWQRSSANLRASMDNLFEVLKETDLYE